MTSSGNRQIVIGLIGRVMKNVITLRTGTAKISRESRDRYLPDISSGQESVGRIGRERIDRGERLDLLSDDAIEPNSGGIDHRWREDVTFLDTGTLALRKRPQKNAVKRI